MNKLLSAGFARLKKDKFFWVCVGLMAAAAWYTVFTVCLNRKEYDGYNVGLDAILFGHVFCMGILTAAFSGLFIGTEYSGGTIRNKLVIGHTRGNIISCGDDSGIDTAWIFRGSYGRNAAGIFSDLIDDCGV